MHAIHVNQNTSPNWYQFMLLKICPHCWWFRNRSNQLIWRIYHYLQDFTSQMVQDFFHQQFQKILIHTLNIRTLGWRVQVFHRGKSRRFIYFFSGCLASFSKASALPLYFESGSIGNNLGQTWRNGSTTCTWNTQKQNANAILRCKRFVIFMLMFQFSSNVTNLVGKGLPVNYRI